MKTFCKFKNLIYSIIFIPFLFTPISSQNLLENNLFIHSSNEVESLKEKSTVPKGYSIEQVSTGHNHSAAVITDGTSDSLYTWGDNTSGQLGLGDNAEETYNTPQKVDFKGIKEEGLQIEQISMGNKHSAAVLKTGNNPEDDQLYTWGYNGFGQLGNGAFGPEKHNSSPTLIEGFADGDNNNSIFTDNDIEQISLGENDSAVVINNDGTDELYTWGQTSNGKLGYAPDCGGQKQNEYPKKVELSEDTQIEEISMGDNHSAAITTNGISDELYTWGDNRNGQLGLGEEKTADYYTTPQKVDFEEIDENGLQIEQISAGRHHSAVVINNNELYTWGKNDYGQLGFSGASTEKEPQKVSEFNKGKDIQQTSLGYTSSSAIVEGDLYTWGDNRNGQLGVGEQNTNTIDSPMLVDFNLKNTNVKQISISKESCLAIVNDGKHDYLYTWGLNDKGQLGLGNNVENVYKPQQINFSFLVDLSFNDHWYFYFIIVGGPILVVGLLLALFLYYKNKRIII